MVFATVLLSLLLLIVFITYFKINAFLSFLIVSILAGITLGIPLAEIPTTVERGIAGIMGSRHLFPSLALCAAFFF